MDRRRFLGSMGGGALGAASLLSTASNSRAAARAQGASRPPNIIFILADDLGYGDLGCYGQETIATPHLDRMAAEGIRFTQAYAGSTVCAPSRCCLMTGKHTGHARVRGNARFPLLPEDTTVAELLKSAGYRTALIGKWGLGEAHTTGIPNRKGFDTFYGYLNQQHAHNFYPHHLWQNEREVFLIDNWGPARRQYSHDLFTARALDYVDKNRHSPFFLYLSYTVPHANNELGRETGDGMEVPDYGPSASKPWKDPLKGFAGMVHRLDRDVGALLDRLKDAGIDDNTVVFFSSDNGPHREGGNDPDFFRSSGPLRGIKRDLYEGGIRVPTLARWPGKIRAGQVSDQVWSFWDFLPTAAELAGAPAPTGIDGISMAPALLGKPQRNHEFLYWEFHERGFTQAVRMGHWKGVRFGTREPLELYNLAEDLGETTNVAARHPGVVAKIEAYLRRARTDSKEFPVKERPAPA
jgi:arylsulfatase A-like enzyme